MPRTSTRGRPAAIDGREAAILDAEHSLIQALFDYGQPHPDPGLRAITWTREHAMLALATATAPAGGGVRCHRRPSTVI